MLSKASNEEVYNAYLKLILDFRDDLEAQNLLNKAFGVLSEESSSDKGKRLFRVGSYSEALPFLEQVALSSNNPDDYSWVKCCQDKIQNKTLDEIKKEQTDDKYIESLNPCPFAHKDIPIFGTPVGRPGSSIITSCWLQGRRRQMPNSGGVLDRKSCYCKNFPKV